MAKKEKNIETKPKYKEDIRTVDYSEEMRSSYIDYSLSVITERALPDIRDGLKPVHRRILYGMKCLGLKHNLPYKKSARIVGEVMGKFHPHGDASIYDAMAHMAQDWYYIYPLVDGHGNFGSIEGDEQAASRYTEARLSAIAEELFLQDLEKGVVNFIPNFDDNEYEPSILPVKIPNILLSGTEGIAVGMASKIPTHNLGEIIDGVIATMDNPNITTAELLKYIKGPDFSTGGIVANANELVSIYENGIGKIRLRGKATIVDAGNGKSNIIITEIPQTMIGQIDKFMETVANLVYTKALTDVEDIKNFSGKEGIKIVVELKKNANPTKILNILYKKAKLEDTFGYNAMAICNGYPRQLGLREILTEFITFNAENYTKRYNYLLNVELRQQEIKEGLIKAIGCVDIIIEILRGANSISNAKDCLMNGKTEAITFKTKAAEKQAKKLCFTEQQANAILDMKLQRLVGLEIIVLEKELQQHIKNITHYTALLKSKIKMKNQIKKDLTDIKNRYATQRKTEIINAEEVEIIKEEIAEEVIYVVIDKFGYTKALDEATYERNIESISQYKYCIKMKNTDKLCIFTDANKCHYIKGLQIPIGKFKDKGTMLNLISNYNSNETILLMQPLSDIITTPLIFVNEDGMVKIVNGNEFDVSKRMIDSTKKDSGKLVGVFPLKTEKDIVLQTQNNFFVRFKIEEISEMKRTSIGVRGIKLSPEDKVIAANIGSSKTEISEILFSSIKLTKRDVIGTQKLKKN